jgi:hypothetical protein
MDDIGMALKIGIYERQLSIIPDFPLSLTFHYP